MYSRTSAKVDEVGQPRLEVRELRKLSLKLQPHRCELLHLDAQILGHVFELGHELVKLRADEGRHALWACHVFVPLQALLGPDGASAFVCCFSRCPITEIHAGFQRKPPEK